MLIKAIFNATFGSKADARQIGLWNTAALALILKANDFQQALGVFESLINKVPNYLDALNNYGVCLMHKDKVRNISVHLPAQELTVLFLARRSSLML